MNNWRTFVDYEIEYVDKETGEILYKIIGKKVALRDYEIDKKDKRIEYGKYNTKRIIYRCRPKRQLRLF